MKGIFEMEKAYILFEKTEKGILLKASGTLDEHEKMLAELICKMSETTGIKKSEIVSVISSVILEKELDKIFEGVIKNEIC